MQFPKTNCLKIEKLSTIFDNFNELVFIKDEEFRIIYANPAFLFQMGYHSQEAVLGKTAIDLWPEFAFYYQQHDLDTVKGDMYFQVENSCTNNGKNCFTLTQKNPIKDDDGNILALVCRSNLFFNENLHQLWSSIHSLTPRNSIKIKATASNLLDKNALTAREEECLFYILQHKPAKVIAKILMISSRTVETHVANIKLKWNISNKEDIFEKASLYGYVNSIPLDLFKKGSSLKF